MLKFKFLIFLLMATSVISAKEYHVSVTGSDRNDGSASNPFRTINYVAQLAVPGDVITVHAGIYRERINPARGGEVIQKELFTRQQREKRWSSPVPSLLKDGKRSVAIYGR